MRARHVSLIGAVALSCSAGVTSPATTPAGVVASYVAISTALAEDKLDSVAALSGELERHAVALKGKPGIAKVVANLPGLARNDLATVRTAFKPLSDGMIEYMRAETATQTGNVMVFCPMAFNDQGALWIQAEGKVANPYFGASMLFCGNKLAWDAELPTTAAL